MNTLFSAAVGNGAGLSEEEWKQFLVDVTFPLLEQVGSGCCHYVAVFNTHAIIPMCEL